MNEIRQVAIYCRVSTEEQATEGYSISAQLQTLRQYAQLYGWEITGEYVDEGISGKNISGRPAIQKLIADVDKNKFQAVLVWKISRLSRNMLDTLTLLDLFEDNGVKICLDIKSYLYLAGTELDYSDGLNGKGFEFHNPNASRTCACGESFSV